MEIFKLLKDLKESLDKYAKDYEAQYISGYSSALVDLEDKIKRNIKIKID